jgi:hypothetical protein
MQRMPRVAQLDVFNKINDFDMLVTGPVSALSILQSGRRRFESLSLYQHSFVARLDRLTEGLRGDWKNVGGGSVSYGLITVLDTGSTTGRTAIP